MKQSKPPQKSQREVNYRRGTPFNSCAFCLMYWKRPRKAFGGCTAVSGNITPYGLCNLFALTKNPLGPVLSKQEVAELGTWFCELAITRNKPIGLG
jgi:hypothetical protein